MVHPFFHLFPTGMKKCLSFYPSALFLLFWNVSVTTIGVEKEITPPTHPTQLRHMTGQTLCDAPSREERDCANSSPGPASQGLHRSSWGCPGASGNQGPEGNLSWLFSREESRAQPSETPALDMQPLGSCRE